MEQLSILAVSRYRSGLLTLDGETLCESNAPAREAIIHAYRAQGIDHPKFFKMDRCSQLALIAVEPLSTRISAMENVDRDRIGLVHLGQHGSLDTDQRYWNMLKEEQIASPALFVYTLPNIPLGEISIRHRLHGPSLCLVADVPQLDMMRNAAEQMVEQEGMRHVVCGWSDIFAGRATATFLLATTGAGRPWDHDELERLFDDERH